MTLNTGGKSHHIQEVDDSEAELNLWFCSTELISGLMRRSLKVMGQPLSLASLPVCSARPCCGTLHRGKAFLWPTASIRVLCPRFPFLPSLSSFLFALCLILSPGSPRFPQIFHQTEEIKRSPFIPYKLGMCSTSYTKVHAWQYQVLVTGQPGGIHGMLDGSKVLLRR